ncbi:MAG: class I adenylate-forming enzyme family protein [Marinobacter sp.]
MFPINFLRSAALAKPDVIAAIDGDTSCTYRSLVARSDALGSGIEAIAGKARPVVAMLGPNDMEMLVALMAIHASGSVLVPLNTRNTTYELDAQIAFANPDVLIVHKAYLDKISLFDGSVVVAGADSNDALAMTALEQKHAGRAPEWQAELGDMNSIKFTGGSSGVPKGVVQSFRCTNTMISSVLLTFDLGAEDRYLCAAPMTHGAGAFILPTLARGGCVVMTADSSPRNLLDLLEKESITATWVPPTLLYKLIDEQRNNPRKVASLEHLIWGGAAASPVRLLEARELFGPVVEVIYGQTEAPMMLAGGRSKDLYGDRLTSVGKIGPLAEVGILDPEGRRLAANELGEICGRGDLLMNGYLQMPEETAATIRNGWLHTGDLGKMDSEGFLFVKGRIRDVVITGGFNVYPSDVEAVLAQHPAVSDCVVFGVPDDYWGERLEATVELREGFVASAEEIMSHCKELAGSVKTPKHFHMASSLPRSPVGKVLRREARDAAINGET